MPSLLSSEWEIINGVVNGDGTVTLHSNGMMTCAISSVTNKEYKYYKTIVDITSDSLNNENNFNNKFSIYVLTYYYNNDHEIYMEKDDILGVNTFDKVSGVLNRYVDTNEIANENDIVAGLNIVIINGLDTDTTINDLKLFISQDVSKSQASDLYNDAVQGNKASKMTFIHSSSTGDVMGFRVQTESTLRTFLFRFLNNYLSQVVTDFGYEMIVDHENIDDTGG